MTICTLLIISGVCNVLLCVLGIRERILRGEAVDNYLDVYNDWQRAKDSADRERDKVAILETKQLPNKEKLDIELGSAYGNLESLFGNDLPALNMVIRSIEQRVNTIYTEVAYACDYAGVDVEAEKPLPGLGENE